MGTEEPLIKGDDMEDQHDAEVMREVDTRSVDLLQEFAAHFRQWLGRNHKVNQRIVFEGWCIQKLAGLQVLCCKQAEQIEFLHAKLKGDAAAARFMAERWG
jgi:hypothetical protein